MIKIAVIEDNKIIRDSVQLNLEAEGFAAFSYPDAESFFLEYPQSYFDLLILDILLPGESGINLLKKVRWLNPHIPILMLTVKKELDTKIEALESGADDYLVKPFHMKELILRVRALLRRTEAKRIRVSKKKLLINGFSIDIPTRLSESKQGVVALSEKEIRFLEYLCKNSGKNLPREDILEEVWGMDVDPTPRTIDNYILKFRKLYEDNPLHPTHFITIRNSGYSYLP